MRIAVIGSGNVGGALAAAAVKAGHSVVLSAGNPEHAQAAAAAAGAEAAGGNAEAVAGADVVVLAVPYAAVAGVAAEIAGAVGAAAVVDASNPLKPDFSGLATGERSGAEELAELLPGTPVVKAFNTVFAGRLGDPTEDGSPLDGFVAGDDATAKATVSELFASLGFRPVDAGGLASARALEQMAFLNIGLNAMNGWPWRSAWKLVGPIG